MTACFLKSTMMHNHRRFAVMLSSGSKRLGTSDKRWCIPWASQGPAPAAVHLSAAAVLGHSSQRFRAELIRLLHLHVSAWVAAASAVSELLLQPASQHVAAAEQSKLCMETSWLL